MTRHLARAPLDLAGKYVDRVARREALSESRRLAEAAMCEARAMTTVLYQDEWATLTVEAKEGLVRYERTAVAYADARDTARSFAGVGKAAERIPPGMKLLLDVRRAPPRNDAEFEATTNRALDALLKRFTRYATLVRTAVGKLHTRRLSSHRGSTAHVFDDEQEALAYLKQTS